MGLNGIDYAVVVAYLVAITLFGSRFARFQRTTGDYFLTGRTVPWWAICFTVVATETSTLTFIGVPAAAYAGNMTFLQLAAGYVAGRVIVSVLFLPAYFRGELVTSYQLLQQRFGTAVKTVAAGLFLLTRSLADGIRLFATALVISIVAGVPVSITIVVLGAAMIWYTMRGGVAAVIWTDVVQMFVYVTGALIVLVAVWHRIPGGVDDIIRVGSAAGRFTVLDWSVDPRRWTRIWNRMMSLIPISRWTL
jgi:SSS family solute:Na+ symporter